MDVAAQVVEFWKEAGPAKWFARDDAFDAQFRQLFLDEHFAAASRAREHWLGSAEGALALMLLLDQFPRWRSPGPAATPSVRPRRWR